MRLLPSIVIAGCLASLSLQSSTATARTYGYAGDWQIVIDGETCASTGFFKSGAVLTIMTSTTDGLSFWMQKKDWNSLKSNGVYELEVEFDNWGRWPVKALVIDNDGDGKGLGWSRSIAPNSDGDSFVAEFAAAKVMTVFRNGEYIEGFNLKGTHAAVLKILECVRSLRNGDPFKGDEPDQVLPPSKPINRT